MTIESLKYPEAPPHDFKSVVFSRCPYEYRVAELGMCLHEICAKGGFIKELYLKMHFQRQFVSGPING